MDSLVKSIIYVPSRHYSHKQANAFPDLTRFSKGMDLSAAHWPPSSFEFTGHNEVLWTSLLDLHFCFTFLSSAHHLHSWTASQDISLFMKAGKIDKSFTLLYKPEMKS